MISPSDLSLVATYVPTQDIILGNNEQTRNINTTLLERMLHGRSKIGGVLRVCGGSKGHIEIEFTPKGGTKENLTIATNGSDEFDGGEQDLETTDHTFRIAEGGNAFNTFRHLQLLHNASPYEGEPPIAFRHHQTRRILHIPTENGIVALGDLFPDDVSHFEQFRDTIRSAFANITEFSLAELLQEEKGSGHQSFLNPTTSKFFENGSISREYGKPPALSTGLPEIATFLRGARPSGTFEYAENHIIRPSIINDKNPAFDYGTLNPRIQHEIDEYGWQFSDLLHRKTDRKQTTPHDLAISAGAAGGANRMDDLWAFTSNPSLEGLRRMANISNLVQWQSGNFRTDFKNIMHTAGCGDSTAAIQVYASKERANIEKEIGERFLTKNRQKQKIAHVVYVGILMRIQAILTLHTHGTTIDHLPPPFIRELHTRALQDAFDIGEGLSQSALHPGQVHNALTPYFNIHVALWRQGEEHRWPTSPIPTQLHGPTRT